MRLNELLWFRTPSGGGAGTIPGVRLFNAQGVQVWPTPNTTKDLTISETWQSLNTIWAEIAGTDPRTPHGFLCDALTENVEVAIHAGDPGASGQESFTVPAGQVFSYGTSPFKDVDTVNVSGEVLTSSSYAQGTLQTATLTAVNQALTINCEGMGQAIFECTALAGSGSPAVTVGFETSIDGGTKWCYAPAYYTTTASSLPSTASATLNLATTTRYIVNCAGATHVRARATAVSTTAPTPTTAAMQGIVEATTWNPALTMSGGITSIYGFQTHDLAVNTYLVAAGAEARATDGTAVASGDATRIQADLQGRLVVQSDALRANKWKYSTPAAFITTSTKTTLKALESSTIQCLKDLSVKNHSTTAVIVTVYSAATDTGDLAAESDVLWRGKVDGDGPVAGSVENFSIERMTTSGHAIVIHTSAAGEIEVNAAGYKVAG